MLNALWPLLPLLLGNRHIINHVTSSRLIAASQVHVLQYTTRKTGQKTRVPRVSPFKTAGHFRGQLSASRNLQDILSSVDFPWFQRHRNTRPAVYYRVTREMLRVRHFSRDLPRVTLARHCPFSCVVYCISTLTAISLIQTSILFWSAKQGR